MEPSAPLDAVRIWTGLAWYDASLSFVEETALRKLIMTSGGLTSGEREEALQFLRLPGQGGVTGEQAMQAARRLSTLPRELREELHRVASLLAQLDGIRLSNSEKTFLQQLRTTLGLPAESEAADAPSRQSSRSSLLEGQSAELPSRSPGPAC